MMFFEKKRRKVWWVGKKGVLLHPQIRNDFTVALVAQLVEHLTLNQAYERESYRDVTLFFFFIQISQGTDVGSPSFYRALLSGMKTHKKEGMSHDKPSTYLLKLN